MIRVANPRGMAPGINPSVLADTMAQSAVNCLLGRGVAAPLRGTTAVGQATKTAPIRGIFPYGGQWFNWVSDVDVCRSPIAQDAWNRVYFTGGAAFPPQMTVAGPATSGTDYPSVSYRLGIPAPDAVPTVTVSGTPTDTDPTLAEARSYVYTYVSAYGEEGPPSPPSALVDVSPGQSVAVSGMSGPDGAYNITHKRLYRTNTGSAGTEYQLVATLTGTSYTDALAADELGSVLPSEDWGPPPEDLHSLIALPCGSLAGLSGNQLCVSEPYLPHAWPTAYRLSFDADGVSIGAYGSNILVTTQGVPHLVSVTHPSSMAAERLEEGYACVSKRGMVDMGYALIYPAVNGLMVAGMGETPRLLTKDLIDQEDWAAFAPETIHAYIWDKKYVAFWENGTGAEGFIYDPASGDLVFHTIPATAGYHDPMTGTLYLASGTDIFTWNTGAALIGVWKSKKFRLRYPVNHSCAKVVAEGPVTFKLWADGVLKLTRTVDGPDPFRLPGGFRAGVYEFEISGEHEWQMVAMAQSLREVSEA